MNYVLVFIFFVIGAFIYWNAIVDILMAIRAKGWPSSAASINYVELQKVGDGMCSVIINYTYWVAGIEYKGDRLSFGYTASSLENNHKKIFDKLKTASVIDARYNAKRHSESCLATGITSAHLINISFVVIWTGFAIGLLGVWLTNVVYPLSPVLIVLGFLCSFILSAFSDYLLLRKLKVIL